MDARPNVAAAAILIGDPARAAMLAALLHGRARPAGDLACAAGVTPPTASSHLAKLLAGGLLTVEAQGRHRHYRIAGAHVAQAIEALAAIGTREPPRRRAVGRETRNLAFARCCYDHLAGRLGVAVACGLQERDVLVPAADRQFHVTPAGAHWFEAFGLNTAAIKQNRRGSARQCLDWTERRPHLAGPLGVQLMSLFCAKGWLRRIPSSRAVDVTQDGWRGLKKEFGIEERDLRSGLPASLRGS